jgi:hypothetical protein
LTKDARKPAPPEVAAVVREALGGDSERELYCEVVAEAVVGNCHLYECYLSQIWGGPRDNYMTVAVEGGRIYRIDAWIRQDDIEEFLAKFRPDISDPAFDKLFAVYFCHHQPSSYSNGVWTTFDTQGPGVVELRVDISLDYSVSMSIHSVCRGAIGTGQCFNVGPDYLLVDMHDFEVEIPFDDIDTIRPANPSAFMERTMQFSLEGVSPRGRIVGNRRELIERQRGEDEEHYKSALLELREHLFVQQHFHQITTPLVAQPGGNLSRFLAIEFRVGSKAALIWGYQDQWGVGKWLPLSDPTAELTSPATPLPDEYFEAEPVPSLLAAIELLTAKLSA